MSRLDTMTEEDVIRLGEGGTVDCPHEPLSAVPGILVAMFVGCVAGVILARSFPVLWHAAIRGLELVSLIKG